MSAVFLPLLVNVPRKHLPARNNTWNYSSIRAKYCSEKKGRNYLFKDIEDPLSAQQESSVALHSSQDCWNCRFTVLALTPGQLIQRSPENLLASEGDGSLANLLWGDYHAQCIPTLALWRCEWQWLFICRWAVIMSSSLPSWMDLIWFEKPFIAPCESGIIWQPINKPADITGIVWYFIKMLIVWLRLVHLVKGNEELGAYGSESRTSLWIFLFSQFPFSI